MKKKVLVGIAVLATVCGFAMWQVRADGGAQKAETISQANVKEEEDACMSYCPKTAEGIEQKRKDGFFESPIHPGVFHGVDHGPDHFFPRTKGTDGRGLFFDIQERIIAAQQRGEFKAEDFEKLDFSLPNEKTYGDNPQFEIFNPNGPFKAKFYDGGVAKLRDLKEITEPDSRVMFVRVRQELGNFPNQTPTIREIIYGVVTNIKKEVCETYPFIKAAKRTSPVPLNAVLKPTQNGYVVDQWFTDTWKDASWVDSAPCVEDTQGKWFYFGRIVMREQTKGDTKWRM